MIRSLLGAAVDDVRARAAGMVLRGVVRLVTEAGGLRRLQVTARKGEVFDDAPHWEPLGLTSRPLAGAEAVAVQLSTDLTIIRAVVDRRYRPTDSDAGETGLYDCTTPGPAQQRIRLRPGVGIEVEAPNGVEVRTGTVYGAAGFSAPVFGLPVAGKTGTFTESGPGGQTLIFSGGILVGGTGVP